MTNSKWLRRALLGGVAIGVMSTGAQADDLDDLKAQIEALQNRVNTLESQPSGSAIPEGASLITFQRGQGSLADWNVDRAREGSMPSDRGFTVAVTPTADVPAPVTEVTVSGYVKGDFIWDFNQDLGDTFTSALGIDEREQKDVHFQAHAKQTRFRIRSSTDTAIGQIRTLIEGDFYGGGNSAGTFRLRHAWGEWDMTPNWTLGIGRFWRTGYNVFTGVTLVDFGGSVGDGGFSRNEQIRLTYSSGPMTVALAIQDSSRSVGTTNWLTTAGGQSTAGGAAIQAPQAAGGSTPDFPGFGAHMLYDVPGGHQIFLGGAVQQTQLDSATAAIITPTGLRSVNKSKMGWHVTGGANVNLFDIATFTSSVTYCDGFCAAITGGGPNVGVLYNTGTDSVKLRSNRAFGGYAGISFDATDTTSINAQFGFIDNQGSHAKDAGVRQTHAYTVHANVIWQPVRQMRLGWEVMWGKTIYGTRYLDQQAALGNPAKKNNDAIRGQFGAWFFF